MAALLGDRDSTTDTNDGGETKFGRYHDGSNLIMKWKFLDFSEVSGEIQKRFRRVSAEFQRRFSGWHNN